MYSQSGLGSDNLQSEEAVAAIARDLARDGQAAFAVLGEDMAKIRTAHMEIGQNLQDFADLVAQGDAGVDKLHALESSVEALLSSLVRFLTQVGGAEAREQLRDTRSYLEAIDRAGKTLTAISTLTRTTSSSLGVTNLGRYLHDLSQTAGGITDAVTRVSRQLETLADMTDEMRSSCADAAETLRGLKPQLAERRSVLVQLGHAETRASEDLAGRARRLSDEGKRHIKIFITAMQFSDRLAQRLDHVSQMLEEDPRQVARLGAAQARRCAQDIFEIARETGQTMALLADLGRQGAALFSDGALAKAISDALSKRAETVSMVRSEMARVDTVIAKAQTNAAEAARTAEATGEAFAQLSDGSKSLAIASINSMLFSARSGRASGPLVALSIEVRQTAADCLAAVGGGQSGLNALISRNDQAHEQLVTATDALTKAVKDYDGLTEAGEQRLEQINTLRGSAQTGAETLLTLVQAVDRSLEAMDQVGQRLNDLAAQLDAVPGQITPDPAVLTRIWASYTMDEERTVHAELYADTPGMAPAAAEEAAETLDDLLF